MMFLPLLSMLGGKGKWLLIFAVVAAGLWSYWAWSRHEIDALHQQVAVIQKQADDLQAANAHIQADIETVRQAQERAARTLQDARTRSATASAAVRQQHLAVTAKTSPSEVQARINADTAATFKGFEDATHTP